ncbi:MAG: FAD-binding protein [Oscillospiraceae bacterium]|nr:FAD-binding protein [Oscillospiraceae bacterium]
MIRIGNLKLGLDGSEAQLTKKAAQLLGVSTDSIKSLHIAKKAVDARDKTNVHFVYSVDVAVSENEQKIIKRIRRGDITLRPRDEEDRTDAFRCPEKRPVVVGAGPAGLFAALTLARAGAKPILIERGEAVEKRAETVNKFWSGGELNTSSNVQFGEGGAGAFSDGKLNSGTHDKRRFNVFRTFVEHGAPPEIMYIRNPHIGSDNLPGVVSGIREEIKALGGTVLFNHTLVGISSTRGRVSAITCKTEYGEKTFETDDVVLAVGHSARDTFEMRLELGVVMEQKPFSMGVRIEHLQSDIDKCRYGSFAGHPALGAADYKLSNRYPNGRAVYTFCMCPGGQVINASSEDGMLVTNGMSLYARNLANANSAMLVNVTPEDFGGSSPLAGVELQRRIERAAYTLGGNSWKAPAQTVEGFLTGKRTGFSRIKPTFMPGVCECDISQLFPEYITETLRSGLSGFSRLIPTFRDGDAVLTAPETRSSSPVRILRDDVLQSSLRGLYPCGEGAGYAGGILSSAVDGIRVAEAVLKI